MTKPKHHPATFYSTDVVATPFTRHPGNVLFNRNPGNTLYQSSWQRFWARIYSHYPKKQKCQQNKFTGISSSIKTNRIKASWQYAS
ncbi:hypothetical protein [Shewanella gaetbuli]|uniref:Uncharacterized protein n=1 Tax=Shewanella gaetbuli TaxID=220752 RepID=A0A9X1ZFT7_9GAMM|nr:hypothetical protein [Shewanella gaetbuli]MCL1141569.1 hypothetical protein [Shewanella gaetbuli]